MGIKKIQLKKNNGLKVDNGMSLEELIEVLKTSGILK